MLVLMCSTVEDLFDLNCLPCSVFLMFGQNLDSMRKSLHKLFHYIEDIEVDVVQRSSIVVRFSDC